MVELKKDLEESAKKELAESKAKLEAAKKKRWWN